MPVSVKGNYGNQYVLVELLLAVCGMRGFVLCIMP